MENEIKAKNWIENETSEAPIKNIQILPSQSLVSISRELGKKQAM